MHQIESDDGDNGDSADAGDDEAVGFCAELHAYYTRKTFEYYKGIADDKWIMRPTDDTARVNGKTGELFKTPHVPCKNHLLNPKMNSIVASTPDLQKS